MNKTLQKLNKKWIWSLGLLFCSASITFGQQLNVSGTVTDIDSKDPLIGVSIVIEEKSTGTVTDLDGRFEISVEKGSTLVFSYTGMRDQKVIVTKPTINISMESSIEDLDEVVVVGYGTQKKKEVTGAVAQLKSEELDKFITSDVSSALQGQVAGVNVTAASGAPGETAQIQIRGITSLNGTNTPLFVVDGIPQDGDPRLARNEIETIDILKDAASASVYGTRGAAGVILITTKRGENGKTKVSFDQTFGVQDVTSGTPTMNTAQQIRFDELKTLYVPGEGDGITTSRPEWAENETDLNDFIFNPQANTQSYNLGISGGTKEFSYQVVAGLFDQDGVIVNSGFKRYNGRINTAYNKGRWSIRAIASISTENLDRSNDRLVLDAIRYRPYYPSVDINATTFEVDGGPSETATDFLLQRLKNTANSDRERINGSLNIGFEITKNLSFTTNAGAGISNTLQRQFVPPFAIVNAETNIQEIDPTRSFSERNSLRNQTNSFDGTLAFKETFGQHKLNVQATYSADERHFERFEAGRQGVANPSIDVLNGATINPYANSGTGTQGDYDIKTIGMLGRVQYGYADKYLLSASVRRDGSSKFSRNNRWGVFPSVSVGWNIAQEDFWQPLTKFSDNFKVRASYGTTGNESFPAYQYAAVISQGADYLFGESELFGAVQRTFANNQVKWETSKQTNLGIDLGLWENKLTFTADYYSTKKEDMLFPIQLPASSGVLSGANANLILNVGDMTNKGIELSLNYRDRIGDFKWGIAGTYTRNRNEITSINGSTELIYNANGTAVVGDASSAVTTLALGREVGAYFLYQTDGVIKDDETLAAYQEMVPNATLGDLKYIDIDGDGSITQADRVYDGSALPDFEMGINVNLNYKNIDFIMNWYGAVGHEVMNGSAAYAHSFERHLDLANMWTPENPTSDIPLFKDTGKNHPNFAGATDYWLEDGTYFRLRAITLGYTLPQSLLKRAGLGNFRIYVSAQNPITITNYTGYDPEVGGNVAQRGLDRGRYPITRQFLFGTQLDF